ncbi:MULTISPECIES: sensor histidine kinase [Nocardiopsidaceae]|uniref:histidine kinase n=1 Tax=Streptomonospora nanhaiensis TaxID=1323731 RepID=A0ABY6YNX0_9ACTN|nr:ATP-binding protein [Streptomonospora nanhaiensis]WAE74082.1 histidine kinase [Streptomonospora nanhaiensis]
MREGTRETVLRWGRPAAGAALWTLLGALTVVELFDSRDRPPVFEALALVLALAVSAVLSRPHPLTALAVMLCAAVLQMTASGVLLVETFVLTPWLALLPLAFLAGLRSERVRPVTAMVVAACVFTLAVFAAAGLLSGYDTRTFLSRSVDWLGGALTVALTTVTPWLLGRYLLLRGRLARDGWAIAERMERARAADADRARLRERARIATRMHDSLGHDLALIAVRAAALEMSAPDGSDRRNAAAELRTAAHEANLRLREVIGVLREGDGDAPAEPVSALVRRAADAGMPVRLLREGTDPDPGSPGGAAVHRVVQEALTNAAKYAPGSEITVRVVREGGLTRVSVLDTGPPGAMPALPARRGPEGSGLAGLRSLVEGLGGELATGPADGAPGRGFSVRATVPDAPSGGDGAVSAPGDPAGADAPSQTRRAHAEARARARRRLVAAVAVPAALGAGAALAGFALLWWVGTNSVLPPEAYGRISVGDDRALVEQELPRFAYPRQSVDDRPPDPPGSVCSYYLVRHENGLPPVYRLCFADGVLVAKDEIRRFE